MSLVFYVIGFYCKKKFITNDYNNNLNLLLLFLLVPIILLDYNGVITVPYYDMYRQHYGFPVFNLIMPIICFILVRSVSLLISKIFFIKNIFMAIGQAAMPIMYLHLILPTVLIQGLDKVAGLNIDSLISRIGLGILLPCVFYWFLIQFNFTRKAILGLWH
jgi:hypothetical protein